MKAKDRVLELLEQNRQQSISGERIAESLGVSRAAVWKAIKSLEQEGHNIKAVTNKGYMLVQDSNVLSVQGIKPYLEDEAYAENLHVYSTIESTNKTAKELAVSGCSHGTVVVADSQTAGRGRYGRKFYSPSGSGLYMSIVLRADAVPLSDVVMITSAAAVISCRVIEKCTGVKCGIKWVNDLYVQGKKVCGILTEGVTGFETGQIDWVVVGIGINIDTKVFPDDIGHIAASLMEERAEGTLRSRIAAGIINEFMSKEVFGDEHRIMAEYRERQILMGHAVKVVNGNTDYEAEVLDVDDEGRLIVRRNGGQVEKLFCGEVSVKKVN